MIRDPRSYGGIDVGSDHCLVSTKIAVANIWKKKRKTEEPTREWEKKLYNLLEITPEYNNMNVESSQM